MLNYLEAALFLSFQIGHRLAERWVATLSADGCFLYTGRHLPNYAARNGRSMVVQHARLQGTARALRNQGRRVATQAAVWPDHSWKCSLGTRFDGEERGEERK